ncbi:MAG: hypothetical protein V3U66_00670, partial [Acidobacteriota bacterium]
MQTFLDQVSAVLSGQLPKLLGALAILVVGWLVALGLSALVRNLLSRTTLVRRLAGWVVGKDAAEKLELEKWIAKGTYYVVLVFVLIAFLQTLNLTLTTEPLNRLLTQVFQFVPRVLGGGLLLVIAWVVATALHQLVGRLLLATRLDERLGGQAGVREEKRPPLS